MWMLYLSSQQPCPPRCQLFSDGLTSSAGVRRSIEKPFLLSRVSADEEKQHGRWQRRGNLKISQKQRSRLEGVELDKPVSSIYSRPAEVPHVQVVAALRPAGSQIHRITTHKCWIDLQLGHILSSNPFFLSACLSVFLNKYEIDKEGGLRALKNNIRLTATAVQPNSPTDPLITAYTLDKQCTKISSYTEFHQFMLLINTKAAGQSVHIPLKIPYREGGGFMLAELQEANRCPIWAELCWEYQV